MDDITRQLDMRRPATVVRSTLVDTRPTFTMVAPYHRRADLSREVLRQAQRGQVRPIDARPRWNERAGQWEQRCVQLKPPPPAWRKPALIVAAIVTALAILLAVVRWFLLSLAALPLGAICGTALCILALLIWLGRSSSVRITQNNYIGR